MICLLPHHPPIPFFPHLENRNHIKSLASLPSSLHSSSLSPNNTISKTKQRLHSSHFFFLRSTLTLTFHFIPLPSHFSLLTSHSLTLNTKHKTQQYNNGNSPQSHRLFLLLRRRERRTLAHNLLSSPQLHLRDRRRPLLGFIPSLLHLPHYRLSSQHPLQRKHQQSVPQQQYHPRHGLNISTPQSRKSFPRIVQIWIRLHRLLYRHTGRRRRRRRYKATNPNTFSRRSCIHSSLY